MQYRNWLSHAARITLVALLTTLQLLPAEEIIERPNLAGRVSDEAGKAVAGATVFIHSAGPKTGSSIFCPTCYPDCRKRATTDDSGNFQIQSLDPTLKFKVLAVAKGYEPTLEKDVNPGKRQLVLVVSPRDPELLISTNRLAGQAFAPSGKPLAGAVITVEGVELRNGSTTYGGTSRFVDETMVTDDRGFFLGLVQSSEAVQIIARIEAPSVAPRWISLKPGKDQIYQTGEGVTVSGRVVYEEKPVAGVIVGLTSKNRSAGQGFHDLNARTDERGRFVVENVPPRHEFVLYGKMKDLAKFGSIGARPVTTQDHGSTMDLSDLPIGRAFTLRGEIVLPPGKTLPPRTHMYLGREDAWDSHDLVLEEDGFFEFRGVPAESISMGLRIRGLRLSKKNPSLDWLNGRILGRMDRDINDFKILLEPGEWEFNRADDADMPAGVERYPRDIPLKSAP